MSAISDQYKRMGSGVLFILVASIFLAQGAAFGASGLTVPIDSVAQITIDDENRQLSYPSAVFFDSVEEEVYLSNGGSGRVIVYNRDFFPTISIGKGRGVGAPNGGLVMSNGDVYLCQPRNARNPSPRITILNGAFFIDREIFLDQIPEAAGFNPNQLAISSDGLIYVAGVRSRGVMVLDQEGSFLRWIKPEDLVSSRLLSQYEKERQQGGEGLEEEVSEEEEEQWANIPEEFRPRKKSEIPPDVPGPVIINDVTISASGKIFLLSPETAKVYVYGKDESFLYSFGRKGGSPGQMSMPKDMAIDEEREILYIPDYMRHTVLVYDFSGNYLFELGGRGSEPGWFNFPVGVAINSKNELIVSDLFNQRVQVLKVGFEDVLPFLRGKFPGFKPLPQDAVDGEAGQTDAGMQDTQDEQQEKDVGGEEEEIEMGESLAAMAEEFSVEEITEAEEESVEISE